MKVYTKTGDKGITSLVGGSRVSKDDVRIEAYGTVDELMAHIASLRDNMYDQIDLQNYTVDLLDVLDHLMRIASYMASEEGSSKYMPQFGNEQVAFLEGRIDAIQAELKPVDKFTLPGGHPLVSLCHIARTVCRRAERRAITMSRTYSVEDMQLRYLNRLSDYLYVLGRKLSDEFNVKELLWVYEK